MLEESPADFYYAAKRALLVNLFVLIRFDYTGFDSSSQGRISWCVVAFLEGTGMASTGLRCLPTPAGSVLSRFYSTNAKRQQGRTAARYAVNYQTLKVSYGLRISVKQPPLAEAVCIRSL